MAETGKRDPGVGSGGGPYGTPEGKTAVAVSGQEPESGAVETFFTGD